MTNPANNDRSSSTSTASTNAIQADTVQIDIQSYVTLFDQSAFPSLITTPEGRIVKINAAAEILLGCAADKAYTLNIAQFVEPSQNYQHEQVRKAVLARREAVAFDTSLVPLTIPRILRAVHLMMCPVTTETDPAAQVGYQCIDISSQVEVMNLLQNDRDLLDSLIEASSDAVLMVDQDGKVLVVNLQFETFFNISRFQMLNQALSVIFPAMHQRSDLPEAFTRLLLKLANEPDYYDVAGGNFTLQVPVRRDIFWYSQMVHSASGAPLGRLLVLRDTTREREAERAKTEFISLVSHELRTPLTSIRGFTEMLSDESPIQQNAPAREYLGIIMQNVDRLMTLVNDILDVTRLETGRVVLSKSTVDLGELIESVIHSVQPQLERNQQHLLVTVEPNLPSVVVDRTRIGQIVGNLINNAHKYSPPGSDILVVVWYAYRPDQLSIGAPRDVHTPALVVSIRDHGMGIAPADQSRIFTRFYRTDSATNQQIPGSGLGLTIVKSFVEMHGGRVWLQSTVGAGSTFYFTLPT